MYTGYLHYRWTKRFEEIGGIEQVESRSDSTRRHNDGFMPAAPRLCDLDRTNTLTVWSLSRGFARFGLFGFHQGNFGVATEWTDGSLHSLRAGETGIKERHSIDTMLSNAQIAGLRIDATQRERLKGGLCSCQACLMGEPLGGRIVHLRPSTVVSLGIECLQQGRNALLQ